MRIAILGYGKEGVSAKNYLRATYPNADIAIYSDFDEVTIKTLNLESFDLIVRSPSVPPSWLKVEGKVTSVTKLFFDHCPCPIIGVTGTKGKGTTSSLITALLQKLLVPHRAKIRAAKTAGMQFVSRPERDDEIHLVGNIGSPALDILASLISTDVVVYEMSSFQLWDLDKSPHIAIVLGIEPDHLNVHADFDDYKNAKANIVKHQTPQDFTIYYAPNGISHQIALESPGQKLPYPTESRALLDPILETLAIPGQHNRDNAEAALFATAACLGLTLDQLLTAYSAEITSVFSTFQGLPHRLQFLRDYHGVKIYDDNFSTNLASTTVALQAFPSQPIVLIAGGRDKTDNKDLPDLAKTFTSTTNLQKVILIGESGHALSAILPGPLHETAESLEEAVTKALAAAEPLATSSDTPPILLMSPAAASFDMFQNVYDRGAQFQQIIANLP